MDDWAARLTGGDNGPRKGRNPQEGYLRGTGLQFGSLGQACKVDPDFRAAMAAAEGRTIVEPANLMNLFLLVRLHLAQGFPGNLIEFGSYRGGSALFLASLAKRFLPGRRVIALDTFEGMPPTETSIDLHRGGDFADVDLDELRAKAASLGLDNLVFVQGRFEDTAARAAAEYGPFSLAHIDCDIYEAVVAAYEAVRPHLVTGAYIVLDDPLTATCLGAFEAMEELMIRRDGLHAEQAFPHIVFRHGL